MWGTLVGLIERWWREKPRLDIVRAVVQLRDAMIECQNWYSQYLNAMKAGDLNTLYPDPGVEWTRSLTNLKKCVVELDDVLSIFSPEARNAIENYINDDSMEAYGLGLEFAAKELHEPLDLDIHTMTMNASYDEGLSQLRAFITNNFKVEEIQAAISSLRR